MKPHWVFVVLESRLENIENILPLIEGLCCSVQVQVSRVVARLGANDVVQNGGQDVRHKIRISKKRGKLKFFVLDP